MSALIEFLTARLAEDEEKASAAEALASIYAPKKLRWHWFRTDGNSSAWEPTNHTPARVLADVKAKRHLIELYASWQEQADRSGEIATDLNAVIYRTQAGALNAALRILATTYADHPDFDATWAP